MNCLNMSTSTSLSAIHAQTGPIRTDHSRRTTLVAGVQVLLHMLRTQKIQAYNIWQNFPLKEQAERKGFEGTRLEWLV
jgi:hypothetical protein